MFRIPIATRHSSSLISVCMLSVLWLIRCLQLINAQFSFLIVQIQFTTLFVTLFPLPLPRQTVGLVVFLPSSSVLRLHLHLCILDLTWEDALIMKLYQSHHLSEWMILESSFTCWLFNDGDDSYVLGVILIRFLIVAPEMCVNKKWYGINNTLLGSQKCRVYYQCEFDIHIIHTVRHINYELIQ